MSPLRSALPRLVAVTLLALLASGCGTTIQPVKTGTVYPDTLARMQALDMERGAPILMRITKEDSTLEVWKETRSGPYALLKSYPICHFSGALGPKRQEGDRQAPEGFYEVGPGQMNPNSREYLSFNTGYPNAFDRSLGRTGDSLMVHGGCRSVGCYAMTNEQIEEIFGLAHEAFAAGQDKFQLQAFPFHMTAENMNRHADDPNAAFWAMLKEGSDQFEAKREPPDVAVCDKRYVFGASPIEAMARGAGDCTDL